MFELLPLVPSLRFLLIADPHIAFSGNSPLVDRSDFFLFSDHTSTFLLEFLPSFGTKCAVFTQGPIPNSNADTFSVFLKDGGEQHRSPIPYGSMANGN